MKNKKSRFTLIFVLAVMLFAVIVSFAGCKIVNYDKKYNMQVADGCTDFYYSNLSKNQQKLYRMIYKEATDYMNKGKTSSRLGYYSFSQYGLTKDEAEMVWYAFRYDSPAFFMIANGYTFTSQGFFVNIAPEFTKKKERARVKAAISKSVEEVRELLDGVQEDVLKLKLIYDYVLDHAQYESTLNGYTYSIAGVLDGDEKTNSVCQGYSQSITYLCKTFGIDCIYVANEYDNHSTNIVKLGDEWYLLDATNDDRDYESYEHFLNNYGYVGSWIGGYRHLTEMERVFKSYLPILNSTSEISSIKHFVKDGMRYIIRGRKACTFYGAENSEIENLVIPASVYNMNVTSAYDEDNKSLKSVVLPDTVKSVSFKGCCNLETIKLPSSVTSLGFMAFAGCSSLKSIVVPNSVKEVSARVFEGCSSMTSIELPSAATYNYDVLKGCNALTEAIIPASAIMFLPNSVKRVVVKGGVIKEGYFNNFNKLESVTLTGDVKTIETDTFKNCKSLTSVELSDSIESIDSTAFSGCDSLQFNEYGGSLYLGNSQNPYIALMKARDVNVTSCQVHLGARLIRASAFSGCKSLTSISISSGVISIGERALEGCSSLKSITVDSANEKYSGDGNCLIDKTANSLIAGCDNSVIPSYVTSIRAKAFYGCVGLKSINIAINLYDIGEMAFGGCTGLETITVDLGNYKYMALNNCLIERSSKKLVFGCKSSKIPSYVTSIGEGAFSGCEGLTSISIPSNVTSIGESAFKDCVNLTSISLPDSISQIGENAFSGCDSLEYNTYDTALYLGNEDNPYLVLMKALNSNIANCYINTDTKIIQPRAFYNCDYLTNIAIPSGVRYIGDYAFNDCARLESVAIPLSVQYIGDRAFANGKATIYCEAKSKPTGWASYWTGIYTSVKWGQNMDTFESKYVSDSGTSFSLNGDSATVVLQSNTQSGVLTIPDTITFNGKTYTVTAIEKDAFKDCNKLTGIVVPDSVTSIGENAFSGCSGLKSIELSSNLTSIGNYAFIGCTALETAIVPTIALSYYNLSYYGSNIRLKNVIINGGESIDDNVFQIYNPQVERVEIRGNITSLGNMTFYNCMNLKSVIISGDVTSIGNNTFTSCESLTNVTLPSGLTIIGSGTFNGCSSLTSVELPSGLTSIGNSMFSNCSNLESIEIPSGVISIGNYAFSRCNKLADVTIPSGVTEIGYHAFAECINLKSIVIPKSVSVMGSEVFYMCSYKVYCEAESQPSGWDEDWNVSYANTDGSNRQTITTKWGYKETITG